MARIVRFSGTEGVMTATKAGVDGTKGYLQSSDNALIYTDGVYAPRPGREPLGSTNSNVNRLFYNPVSSEVLRSSVTANLLQKYASGSWTDLDTTRKYGSLAATSGVAYLLSNDSLIGVNTTNTGVYAANVPPGLDLSSALSGSSGFLANNKQCAYVEVFGIERSPGKISYGAPGSRIVVSNTTGGTRDVTITGTLPADITTSHIWQVYRTFSFGTSVDPGNEFFLVYEANPSASDVTAKTMSFTDVVPDGAGGQALYTNAGVEGPTQANYPCDAVLGSNGEGGLIQFGDKMWAWRKQPKSSIELNMLSVLTTTGVNARTYTGNTSSGVNTITSASSTTGLAIGMSVFGTNIAANTTITNIVGTTITLSANATGTGTGSTFISGDILTIGGEKFYAYTSEDINNNKFLVSTDVSASIAIRDTCYSLIRVVNRSTASTHFYLRYISGPDELPGRMRMTARTDRSSTYTIQGAGHPAAFFPNLTNATTIVSKLEENVLMKSKAGEPESWAGVDDTTFLGEDRIVGVVALRGAMIVSTTKATFRVTESSGITSYELIDQSLFPLSSSTNPGHGAVVVDNIGYAMSSRGLLGITESFVRPVPNMPPQLINAAPNSTQLRLFAHEGSSFIFVPMSFGTFIYHASLGKWMIWRSTLDCGVYDRFTGKLVYNQSSQVYRTRSAQFVTTEAYDSTVAVTISSTTATTVTLSAPLSGAASGDMLVQGGTSTIIKEINSNVLTVDSSTGFTNAAATVYVGFDMEIGYAPLTQNPGVQKLFHQGQAVFDGAILSPTSTSTIDNNFRKKRVSASFTSDLTSTATSMVSYDASPDSAHVVPIWVDGNNKRAAVLNPKIVIRVCTNNARLIGLSLNVVDDSVQTGKNV